jgi:hypothetical protein
MKLFAAAAMSAVLAAAAFAAGPVVAPKIAAVRAQLYYETKGTFSDDLLTMKDLSLWNTIIGEGSAGGSSSATLITVEVQGQNVGVGDVAVEIVATGQKKKVLGRTTMDVALYDDKKTFFAPLMLTGTGCEEIKITARLTGKGAPKGAVTKTIPFMCGE